MIDEEEYRLLVQVEKCADKAAADKENTTVTRQQIAIALVELHQYRLSRGSSVDDTHLPLTQIAPRPMPPGREPPAVTYTRNPLPAGDPANPISPTEPLSPAAAPRPHGCICPPGAEAGCRGWQCPRRMPTTPGGWSNG